MHSKVFPAAIGVLFFSALYGSRMLWSLEHEEDAKALLQALPKSNTALTSGVAQAAAKSPVVAISAKFEMDKGHLSLSVYTAEKGLGVPAEKNVLKELSGSPEGDAWSPEVEVFKDVPHVSRSSEQLTLMSLTRFSLLDIISQAEKDQTGTVFSITPVVHARKPFFVVLVANQGKVVRLAYDLMSGNRTKVDEDAEKDREKQN
jgi:hypothetical protein